MTANARKLTCVAPNLQKGCAQLPLNSDEILEALQETLSAHCAGRKSALEQSPPELASDIAEAHGLDRLVAHYCEKI